MAQRTTYKGRLTPISEVWTDDTIIVDGRLVELLSRESVRKTVEIPQVQTLMVYRVKEGPEKGLILTKSYLDGEEIEVHDTDGIFTRFHKWWTRRNVHAREGMWHNHDFYERKG